MKPLYIRFVQGQQCDMSYLKEKDIFLEWN